MELPDASSSLTTADTQATDKKIWIAPRLMLLGGASANGGKAAAPAEVTLSTGGGGVTFTGGS